MEINERKIGKVTVLEVKGQANLSTHPEKLSQLVSERLEAGDRLFVINLAECNRMDSMGLGELIKSYVSVTRKEGVLKLASVPLKLRGIISVAKLPEVLEIFDNDQAAINSFGA